MAYDLHRIAHHYEANGSGRDFILVGDWDWRNGRRTPGPQDLKKCARDKVPRHRIGPPKEVARARSLAAFRGRQLPQPPAYCDRPAASPMNPGVERWMRMSAEPRATAEAPSGYWNIADSVSVGTERKGVHHEVLGCGNVDSDDSGLLNKNRYAYHSERVFAPSLFGPSVAKPRFSTETESNQYGTQQTFDTSRLRGRYCNFSESVHPPSRRH